MIIKTNKRNALLFDIEGLTEGKLLAIKHALENTKELGKLSPMGKLSPVGEDILMVITRTLNGI